MELNSAISRRSWPLQACDAELTRRLDPAIIGGVTKGIVTKYLADANGGSRRILRPDCRSGISRICWKIDCQGELNRLRTIDHRRVDRWVLDILENIRRSASAAPTKCDIRKWPFVSSASRGNNPVKGRARSLFIPDRNYSLAKYLENADGGSKRILPSRQTAGAEFPEYAGN